MTGFGSILLDKPLQNSHPAGTQIDVYHPGTEIPGIVDPPSSAKNIYPSPVEQVFAAENLSLKQEVKQLQTDNAALKRLNNQLQDDLSKSDPKKAQSLPLPLPSSLPLLTSDAAEAEKVALEYDLNKLREDNVAMKKRVYQLQDDLSKATAGKNSYETQLRMEVHISFNTHTLLVHVLIQYTHPLNIHTYPLNTHTTLSISVPSQYLYPLKTGYDC